MPTLNKLEYLDETKQGIKTALNQFGAEITDDDTFRSYVDSIKDVYTNWTKITEEDASLTLQPTKKGLMSIGLKGNTSQNGEPNPDYPYPVNVVTGDNSITISNNDDTQSQTYPINLGSMELCKIRDYQDYIAKSTGKNLFSGWTKGKSLNPTNGAERNDESGVYGAVSDYIPVNFTTHTNYYLSGLSDTISSFIGAYNSSKQFLGRTAGSSRKNIGLTSNSFTSGTPQGTGDITYLRITQYTSSSASDVNVVDTLQTQLEIGNDASSYEPYGKVWYKYGAIGKITFIGSQEENWDIANSGASSYFYRYRYLTDRLKTSTNDYKCNNYSFANITSTNEVQGINITNGNELRIRYGTEDTISNFKTWLSTHNTTVYYVLATPTTTEITDTTLISQLEALKNAYSYDTQTNISQTNDNLGFIISASALMKGSE